MVVWVFLCLHKAKPTKDYNATPYIKLQKRCWSHPPASLYKVYVI